MKVLVIAKDGQIRNALVKHFDSRNRPYLCVDGQWLQKQAKSAVIPADIGIVINTLCLEELECQTDKASCDWIGRLADACERAESILIHLSSNLVFDDSEDIRHKETDEPTPSNDIASAFFNAEKIVAEQCKHHVILRTGIIFSHIGDNVLTSLVQKIHQKEPLKFSRIGSAFPVHASDLARVLSAMVDQLSCGMQAWGTYHYQSSDSASHFKFAETVLAVMVQFDSDIGEMIELQAKEESDLSWARPLLSCEKILNTFGIKQLPWRRYVVPTIKGMIVPEKNK